MVISEDGETAMWQRYLCPDCGAVVTYGARFCGKCGTNLSRTEARQIPAQPLPASCSCQYNNQQPEHPQHSGQNQSKAYNQSQARGSPNQYHEFRPDGNSNLTVQQNTSPANDPSTELRSEIFKLLAGLFDKQIEDN